MLFPNIWTASKRNATMPRDDLRMGDGMGLRTGLRLALRT